MKREIIPAAQIAQSIHLLRGQKVMLDSDLAALYGVATKILNQAVKRNRERFPGDFVFQLTSQEIAHLRSQFVTSSRQDIAHQGLRNLKSQFVISSWGGLRRRPYAFTEQGVAMRSSVLNSERAGERTRLACWRWRPRHRELVPKRRISAGNIRLKRGFSASRRKGHASRMRSPANR